jgi:hypothetical protein
MAVAPTTPTLRAGDIYFDTALGSVRHYDGAAWHSYDTLDTAQTISGAKAFSAAMQALTIEPIGGTGPIISMSTSAVSITNRTGVGNQALVIAGMAGQTGSLQLWQFPAGTDLARMEPTGTFAVGTIASLSGTGSYISLAANTTAVTNRSGISNIPFIVKGMASQSGDLQQWQNTGGTPLASIGAFGRITSFADMIATDFATGTTGTFTGGSATFGNSSFDQVSLHVKRGKDTGSPVANIQTWETAAGAVLAYVDVNGNGFFANSGAAGADGLAWMGGM